MRDWFNLQRDRYRVVTHVGMRLAKLGRAANIAVAFHEDANFPYDCRLEKAPFGMKVTLGRSDRQALRRIPKHLACYIFHFGNCGPDVRSMTVAADDGHNPSLARFAASVKTPDRVAMPDPYFTKRRGYRRERRLSQETAMPWADRSGRIIWRGATNGMGRQPKALGDAFDPAVIARLRLCMILAGRDDADALMVVTGETSEQRQNLERFGLVGTYRQERDWLGDKFAIDIDGWTNAWSNLPVRLHFGCCVFKVESQFGFRQWYYDNLSPWEHYIPVRADMSDLIEKIDWARAHDNECRQIAENGRIFVRTMTFETESARAVDIITRHWNHPS